MNGTTVILLNGMANNLLLERNLAGLQRRTRK